jgi:hypothetical protein
MAQKDPMKSDTTILYLTDSALDPFLAEKCREKLLKVSGGRHIVSVSQKPLDFGENICVGEIGRTGLTFDTQIKVGAEHIKTRYVAIAEHDCIYPEEHFNFIPPDDQYFWYNLNVWFMQYHNPRCPEWNGMFSYWKGRKAHSQLICNAERYLESTIARMAVTADPLWTARYNPGRVAEPVAVDYDHTMKLSRGKDLAHLQEKLKYYTLNFEGRTWSTKIPTIDIRHGDNFSGPRRGTKRTFNLPPWGTMEDILNG